MSIPLFNSIKCFAWSEKVSAYFFSSAQNIRYYLTEEWTFSEMQHGNLLNLGVRAQEQYDTSQLDSNRLSHLLAVGQPAVGLEAFEEPQLSGSPARDLTGRNTVKN